MGHMRDKLIRTKTTKYSKTKQKTIEITPKTHYSVSGNRMLHTLTSTRNYSLRFDLQDFEGNSRYASYSYFAVGPEDDGFRLSLSGYSGNAGSCLWQHSAERPHACTLIPLIY